MGVYGEILHLLSNPIEISPQRHLKPSNDRGEFELDLARCYKNIAENLFALGHEMDNKQILVFKV